MEFSNLYFSFDGTLACDYPERERTPIAVYELNGLPPFVPLQRKENLVIASVKQGVFEAVVNGEYYSLKENGIMVLAPFSMYTFKQTDGTPFKVQILVIDLKECARYDSAVTRFLPFFSDGGAITPVPNETAARSLAESVEDICVKIKNGEPAFDNLRSVLKCVCANRCDELRKVSDAKKAFSVIKMAERLADLSAPVKISEIADNCGYSEFYSMKLFKKYVDCSIVDYSNKYRVSVALQMILNTDADIAVIAKSVGFENVSYFNRQFKKLFGQTPVQFRNK